ncbi:hypothetical protein [Flocculibacter collagenilyticus]|uniref:hypothetical protein n=1 Tax=Flocculibacter collagenilyticus TaxID=2744479 RepID=UPI0018F45388|nr:hypothetical protein [Flocculibacter collagenilyticus]
MSNKNAPATRSQFVSFEIIASAIFVITIAMISWNWTNRVAVVDKKFEQFDRRFEKMDEKLDKLILSVNTIQSTMATKDDLLKLSSRVTEAEKVIARQDFRLEHVEKKVL